MPVTNLAELDALVARVKKRFRRVYNILSRESRRNLPRSFLLLTTLVFHLHNKR